MADFNHIGHGNIVLKYFILQLDVQGFKAILLHTDNNIYWEIYEFISIGKIQSVHKMAPMCRSSAYDNKAK